MAESIDATYNYGGLITIKFDYKKVNDHEQPVMQFYGRTNNVFQIPLDTVHKYVDDIPLIDTATKICELLGLGGNRNTIFRVADIIQNHLEELLRMPPTRNAQAIERIAAGAGRPTMSIGGVALQ